MNLSPHEIDGLYVYIVADLARKRQTRGLKLNYPESVALITEAMLEAGRDGRSPGECVELARQVLGRDDVMEGVPSMMKMVQVEVLFPDGHKLVTCHNPIP